MRRALLKLDEEKGSRRLPAPEIRRQEMHTTNSDADAAWALVLMGAPGSGKGTQARRLAETLELPHISTGDMLREAVQEGTALGELAKRHMEAGDLVPDAVIHGILSQRIALPDCRRGFILDGFPRTIEQAKSLDLLHQSRPQLKLVVFNIWVDQDLLMKRTLGRRICPACGEIYNIYLTPPRQEGACDKDGESLISRLDDNEATYRRRQLSHAEVSEPLIDYYRGQGVLYDVDGNWEAGSVSAQIFTVLGGLRQDGSPLFEQRI